MCVCVCVCVCVCFLFFFLPFCFAYLVPILVLYLCLSCTYTCLVPMLDLSSFRVGSRLLFFLAQHLEEAKLVEAS